jgi:hypothetical protein
MRKLLDVIGLVLFSLGIFSAVGFAALIYQTGADLNFQFWLSMAVIVVGWMLSSTATKKYCPKCAETIKYKALRCKHCGYDLGEEPSVRASEPFYK